MSELQSIIERVTRALGSAGLSYVIVGGVAAIFRGKPRTTMDVDIIVDDDMHKIELFLNALKREHFDVLDEQARLGFNMNESVPIFDMNSVLRLDVKIAHDQHEKNVLRDATDETIKGIPVKLATPED
nr:hypothetical protein [Candidatus Sigynarchaeota archaeon]